MPNLVSQTMELLRSGDVGVVIGFREGFGGKPKPVFAVDENSAERLIFNEKCRQNLAVYINKDEVKHFGKIAATGSASLVRSILQLAAENQINEGDVIAIVESNNGEFLLIEKLNDMENYIKQNKIVFPKDEIEKINEILNLSREERWNWWSAEFSKCIKCYACRAACPLCYCERCNVEMNQPQWVEPPSHALGNFEWHINRAMHLAGKCINCGECSRACPLDIPLNLLTSRLNDEIENSFGQRSGLSSEPDYALNSFKIEDKENFIR